MNPHIFVIIPVYNCIQFLTHAVESVLNQPYTHSSIILVDDGSTDGSSALCDQLAEASDRIHVLHKENVGVSSARNAGMDYVYSQDSSCLENSYIAFLDADDAWFPQVFKPETADLLGHGYDLICFQSCFCSSDLAFCRPAPPVHEKNHIGGNCSLWIHDGSFAALLYNSSFLLHYKLKFNAVCVTEDKFFLMQALFLADHIYQKSSRLYQYRQHPSSVMHTRKMGIPYYQPIIDAYLKSDADMAVWANESRGTLKEGYTLARIYIMDMIEEHFQNGGSRQEIRDFLESRPDYLEILRSNAGGELRTKRFEDMKAHPNRMIIKNRICGPLLRILRRIYHIKPIKAIADKRRYPIKIQDC